MVAGQSPAEIFSLHDIITKQPNRLWKILVLYQGIALAMPKGLGDWMPLQGLRNSHLWPQSPDCVLKAEQLWRWKRAMIRNVIESQVPMPRRRPSQYWQALCQA